MEVVSTNVEEIAVVFQRLKNAMNIFTN